MAEQENHLRATALYGTLSGATPLYDNKEQLYMEKDNKTLGQRIAYYRKARNITQEELGEKCGVSSQAVSKWENDLSAPDITLIGTLAEIFCISTDELLGLKKEVATAVKPETLNVDRLILKMDIKSANGDIVKINIPYKLGKLFIQSGMMGDEKTNKALKGIDFDQIAKMVEMGILGPIMDIQSAQGDTVKVTIEQL